MLKKSKMPIRLFCQSQFNWPTRHQPSIDGWSWNAGFLRPVLQTQSFARKGNKAIASAIPRLLFCGSPTAIFWGIAFRVIYPINCVVRGWACPQVCKKVLERKGPPVANSNASATIIVIADECFSSAPRQHRLPNPILWRIRHSVFRPSLRCFLAAKTAAAFRALGFSGKVSGPNNMRIAALAKAFPERLTLSATTDKLNSGQSVKTHPSNNYNILAHVCDSSMASLKWESFQ